jgi:uncharacterized membrane protein
MNTPHWQFWTDQTVKGLGTLFTFLAVFVALFGSWLRYRIFPPRLSIGLSSTEGMEATVYTLDRATNEATPLTRGLWYHVKVENDTRWQPVTGVHIFLRSIEAPDHSRAFKSIWQGYAALGWSHQGDKPEPKTIGYPAECDLCHVIKDPLEVRLSPLIKGQVPDTFTTPFNFIFTLQARGVEADSLPRRFEISWNGKWSDDRTEMTRTNFVVKQLREVDMSQIEPNPNRPPLVSDQRLGLIVYLLYLAAYIFWITALIGVMIAHVRFPDLIDPLLRSHYHFQIRTFWIGLLYLVAGVFLAYAAFPLIGVVVLIWWLIWSLVRNVHGALALNENKPIQEPTSWTFG